MEQQVLELVAGSQSSNQGTRQAAELQLKGLYTNESFPSALVNVGAHNEVTTADRVAALIMLKIFVGKCWSPLLDEYEGTVVVNYDLKNEIRNRLLAIAFDGSADNKVITQTAAIITKIAKADFPESWPTLLESLLGQKAHSNDAQTEGTLIVLSELVQGGLDEESFYQYAAVLLKCLHDIAVDTTKKLFVRAHAVYVFRGCFDFIETLKDKDEYDMKSFTIAACASWAAFFMDVVKADLPTTPTSKEENDPASEAVINSRGIIALKIQVILTLEKIQLIFPDLLQCVDLFTACWVALKSHGSPFYQSYVDGDKQGNLVTVNGCAYTLDMLVIEELEFMQVLLDSPPVKQQLDNVIGAAAEGEHHSVAGWITEVMGALVTFSAITSESEGLWDIDFNVFLSEEAFGEINSNPRTACASFVWKICGWLPKNTLDSILGYMKLIWQDASPSWRHKEAALFMLQQIVEEHKGDDRAVAPDVVGSCITYISTTMNENGHFLRARGHIVMAAVTTAWMVDNPEIIVQYAHQSLKAMQEDDSDIVKTSCIRLMSTYLLAVPKPNATDMQAPVVNSIAAFLAGQDVEDMDENVDVVDAVLQTLRDLIMANPETCLDHNGLDVMLGMVKFGAARDENTFVLIEEGFESAAHAMAGLGADAYARLCAKVLPSIMAALDSQNSDTEQKTALTEVSLNLLKLLADSAVAPLPDGFIESTMPRICRIILTDVDFYLHQQATLCLKELLSNDHARVFAWMDPEFQKGGLEMILLVIGHLLGPQVNDANAAEVGDLAVEIVEKAGPELLGSVMRELLQVVAVRLSTAKHLGLIQSLAMVYARLSLLNAQDVINFLKDIPIGHITALEVVVTKWLENATHFVGFEAVRQNIRALVEIYGLHDARFAGIQVQGEEIVDVASTRIRTRSMAKTDPVKYTVVSAELKLVKLLVNELLPSYILAQPAFGARTVVKKSSSDGSWASTASGSQRSSPKGDSETQKFLVEFFTRVGTEPRFQELYGQLTPAEQSRLMTAVQEYQAMEAQKSQLSLSAT